MNFGIQPKNSFRISCYDFLLNKNHSQHYIYDDWYIDLFILHRATNIGNISSCTITQLTPIILCSIEKEQVLSFCHLDYHSL